LARNTTSDKIPAGGLTKECTLWVIILYIVSQKVTKLLSTSSRNIVGLFDNHVVIANFPRSMPVKELLKSVNTSQRYGQKYDDIDLLTHEVV